MSEDQQEQDAPIKRARVLEFIGSRANFTGFGVGAVGLFASAEFLRRPLLVLGVTAVTYAAGYLLGKDYSKDVRFELATHSDRVEVAGIQKNLASLRLQVQGHSARLPKDILGQLNTTFGLIEEILPRWSNLASFTEHKYTINSIVSQYLPTIIANYINLPASYYHNAAKKQFASEVETQLATLNDTLTGIRDDLYKDAERNIVVQSNFLRDKFASGDNRLML